jgi:hypothetical protein
MKLVCALSAIFIAVKEHYKLSGIQKTAAGALPTAVSYG